MKSSVLLGIPVACVTRAQILSTLLDFATGSSARTVCYVNAHCLNIASTDAHYRDILSRFDLVYAGGQALVWASRLYGCPIPERVNIMDYFNALAQGLRTRNIPIYLLGASKQTVSAAAKRLAQLGLKVAGWHHGYFSAQEEERVIARINAAQPGILIVGMGVPRQEKWIYRNRARLRVNLCWALGGFLEYAAGNRKPAPVWVVICCLEWLYMGMQEPSRLVKRYLIGNILFIFRIFYDAVFPIGRRNET